ncbi:MAG: FAD:protein FMN transferase [Planctomycetia bacterium]
MTIIRFYTVWTAALIGAAIARSEPPRPPERFASSRLLMATTFKIVLYADDEAAATRAAGAAFDRIAVLESIMSDYSDVSELTLLSNDAGGKPKPVGNELFDILSRSRRVSEATDGAFDVTVGPLVRLWRRARATRELPDRRMIDDYLSRAGYAKLVLDPAARTAELKGKGMRLDLGGIAKGYAADEALKVLAAHGVDCAIVVAGGDVAATRRPPPGRDGWTVDIQPPRPKKDDAPADGAVAPRVRFAGGGVSTSGDAEQFLELGGVRYSHIVDPRTGWATTDRVQATVVAPDATTSDALATAVCVLGPEKGIAVVESTPGVAVLVLKATPDGIQRFESKRWKELAPSASDDPTAKNGP